MLPVFLWEEVFALQLGRIHLSKKAIDKFVEEFNDAHNYIDSLYNSTTVTVFAENFCNLEIANPEAN